jgi:hypothetical protein
MSFTNTDMQTNHADIDNIAKSYPYAIGNYLESILGAECELCFTYRTQNACSQSYGTMTSVSSRRPQQLMLKTFTYVCSMR